MRLYRTPSTRKTGDYNLNLTVAEILMIANDSISDYFYTNKLLDLIKREADKLGSRESQS